MNKLLIALALCTALAACNKQEDPAAAPDASAPATEAPASEPSDAADPVDVAGAPQECVDYINRFKACLDKANPQMAAQFKTQLEQAEAQWGSVDAAGKSAAASACKQANDQFAQMATAMQCE